MNLVSNTLNEFEFSYLSNSDSIIIQKIIEGKIINSVVDSNKKQQLLEWKQKITKSVFDERNDRNFSSDSQYIISLSFRFSPSLHGNMKLDIENYLKPILDGIVAGLFCSKEQDLTQIIRFDYDDSNFNTLFIEKLDDCNSEDEGLVITIIRS